MRVLTSKIFDVLDGKPIKERSLEKAIKVAVIVQGIRHNYGPPCQYDNYMYILDGNYGDEKKFDVEAFVSGRVFPSYRECDEMVEVFDKWCRNHDYPVPRTDEVLAYLDYFNGNIPWYLNPVYDRINANRKRK